MYKHLTSLRSIHDLDLGYKSLSLKTACLWIHTYSITHGPVNPVITHLYQILTWFNTNSHNFFPRQNFSELACHAISNEVAFFCKVDCKLGWHFQRQRYRACA